MFDEFVKEARRLFSSKSNGGKQVPTLTNRLHTQKQVLLALSIVLLLGHSQFRDHFTCQGISGVDKKTITDFCLINGTTTVLNRNESSQQTLPHVGHNFVTNERDFLVVNHIYIRSLWLILILMVMCSFFAQRSWAGLFQNEVLQALLQLFGSEKSTIVQAAEKVRPFEMLSLSSSNYNLECIEPFCGANGLKAFSGVGEMPKSDRLVKKIELVDRHVNIYDHKLDYYPNQMIYLLLTRNAAAYKMSSLNLRRQLIWHAIKSTFYTSMQFLLPLIFIGSEYKFYGWNWVCAAVEHFYKLATSPDHQHHDGSDSSSSYSIDYELSSSVFPVSTQCEYQQYSLTGQVDRVTVQCTVAINEICAKLFVAIWWFTAVNILIELYSLLWVVLSAFSARTISLGYGQCYWPAAKEQADFIAAFRHRRAELNKIDQKLAQKRRIIETSMMSVSACNGVGGQQQLLDANNNNINTGNRNKSPLGLSMNLPFDLNNSHFQQKKQQAHLAEQQSERERKRLEAEGTATETQSSESDVDDLEEGSSSKRSHGRLRKRQRHHNPTKQHPSDWSHWCPRGWCLIFGSMLGELVCCRTKRRRRRLQEEQQRDINIYYLLYLLHLRLGKSKSRTEEVIRMTAQALDNYLKEQKESQQERRQELIMRQQQQQQHLHSNQLSPDQQHQQQQQQQQLPMISEGSSNGDEKLL